MESHSRGRRLVTYRSTANNQSQSKTVLSRASTTKRTPIRSRNPRQSNHDTLDSEQKEEQSQGLAEASDEKIYDLPSSDEEDQQQYKPRRKRQRHGSNGHTVALRQDIVGSRRPMGIEKDVKSGGISTKKLNSASPQIMTASPQRRKGAVNHQERFGQLGDFTSRKPRPHTLTPTEYLDITAKPDTSARENERPQNSETQKRVTRNAQPSFKSPESPSMPAVGNGTPGRRRLIDSLGTRERSAEGSSSDMPADSQLSSPLAPPTPTRQPDLALSRTPVESQCDSHGQDPTVAPSPHVRGSKVTYARQRSFLDDLLLETGSSGVNLAAGVEQNDPLVELHHMNPSTGSRARLFTIEEPDNDDGTVRSIHELRQAGGNARYRGAVESIFEDIEDTHISTSGRCSALVQLCGKLLDSKLARQFLECNFDKRLVDLFCRDLDLTSSSLALCAYKLCATGRPLPYILATTALPKLLDISLPLLDVQDDLFAMTRAPHLKIAKATQLSIQHIFPQLQSMLLPDAHTVKLSPCFLILECLKTTIAAIQEKGDNPSGLPVPFLKRLVNLMLSTNSYREKFSTTVGPDASQNLILGLSILEAHTTSGGPLPEDHRDVLSSISSLYGLLSVTGDGPVNTTSKSIQSLYIRVILNVTNSHPSLCDDFATPEMIGELAAIAIANFADLAKDPLAQDNSNSLDTVILALGALINLTEQSETSRIIFLNPRSSGPSLLGQLLQLFLVHVDSTSEAHSVPAVHHNVAVGYLAVLLLALCLNSSARVEVKRSLHFRGLSVIMSTVEEFLQYHHKIEQELQPLPVQGDSSGFHVRLQDLVSRIQHTIE
ncbi:Wings apart-like protein [Penicillium sp. IBT 16267x]|nr:Wings apart-like protein [Penicillium sp. IBT 16267x]